MYFNRWIAIGILILILIINIAIGPRVGPLIEGNELTKYSTDNLDVVYHSSPEDLQKNSDVYGLQSGTAYVLNTKVTVSVEQQTVSGNSITVSSSDGISPGSSVLSSSVSGIRTGSNVTAVPDKTTITLDAVGPKVGSGSLTLSRIDGRGNLVALPPVAGPNNVTYYSPDSYTFGAATYVPSYEDSVYLSSSMLDNQGPPRPPAYAPQGICEKYQADKVGREHACSSLDINTCASTTCCVAIGGNQCVAGNQYGPAFPKTSAPDYYYFQGQCYGNCPY
jgi:hypothetical protein